MIPNGQSSSQQVAELIKDNEGTVLGLANFTTSNPRVGTSAVQQLSKPSVILTLCGAAKRVCYEVEIPQIAEVWGRKTEYISEGSEVARKRGGNLLGLKTFEARWMLTYRVMFESKSEMEAALRNPEAITLATLDDPGGTKID